MKKVFYILINFIILNLILSCSFIALESPSNVNSYVDNIKALKQQAAGRVDRNSKFYATSIEFTGDPDKDFGTNRLLYLDKDNDSTSELGNATKKYHEIVEIYMAINDEYLYLGLKSPEKPEGVDPRYAGACYIFIDNGLPGPLLQKLNGEGLNKAGITGEFYFLDDAGFVCYGERKFSYFIKNYRPQDNDMNVYNFRTGVVDKKKASTGAVTWPFYARNSVTEVAIPLNEIFGSDVTNITDFYLAFRIDDATAADAMGKKDDPNAIAVDWVPEQGEDNENVYGTKLINWLKVNPKTGISIEKNYAPPKISISTNLPNFVGVKLLRNNYSNFGNNYYIYGDIDFSTEKYYYYYVDVKVMNSFSTNTFRASLYNNNSNWSAVIKVSSGNKGLDNYIKAVAIGVVEQNTVISESEEIIVTSYIPAPILTINTNNPWYEKKMGANPLFIISNTNYFDVNGTVNFDNSDYFFTLMDAYKIIITNNVTNKIFYKENVQFNKTNWNASFPIDPNPVITNRFYIRALGYTMNQFVTNEISFYLISK